MRTKPIKFSTVALIALVACSAAPIKDFKTLQWLPESGNCHERLLADGTILLKCYYDDGTNEEKDWIVIKKSDYNKELNYQDLLIKSCKKWK